MTEDEYAKYVEGSTLRLRALNAACEHHFKLSECPRWDYDLDFATLTFSSNGKPRVCATIQVVGSVSTVTNTWLWSWDNDSIPAHCKRSIQDVRTFGEVHGLSQLTTAKFSSDEFTGWELTGIAAQIVRAKGAYRCPDDKGFLFVLFTDLNWV